MTIEKAINGDWEVCLFDLLRQVSNWMSHDALDPLIELLVISSLYLAQASCMMEAENAGINNCMMHTYLSIYGNTLF